MSLKKVLKENRMKIIEIQKELVIEQDGKKIILEKGDRIEVLKEERVYSISIDYDPAELDGDVLRRFGIKKTDDTRQLSGMHIATLTGSRVGLIACLAWHRYSTEDVQELYPELLGR
jgi:hypothetical protein